MLITLFFAVVVAIIGTLAVGGLARWLGGYFTTVHNARVAAFGAAIGYVVGKYSYVRPLGSPLDAWIPIASLIGAIAGLTILWIIFFRRAEPQNGSI